MGVFQKGLFFYHRNDFPGKIQVDGNVSQYISLSDGSQFFEEAGPLVGYVFPIVNYFLCWFIEHEVLLFESICELGGSHGVFWRYQHYFVQNARFRHLEPQDFLVLLLFIKSLVNFGRPFDTGNVHFRN